MLPDPRLRQFRELTLESTAGEKTLTVQQIKEQKFPYRQIRHLRTTAEQRDTSFSWHLLQCLKPSVGGCSSSLRELYCMMNCNFARHGEWRHSTAYSSRSCASLVNTIAKSSTY
jgi:hypothetical protein